MYRLNQEKLPTERRAITHKFKVGQHEGYITVGLYEDGRPGELFLVMNKEGSTLRGFLDTVGILTSLLLQHGVPLSRIAKKLSYVAFEPSGYTGGKPEFAHSIVDYVFRWLRERFPEVERESLPVVQCKQESMNSEQEPEPNITPMSTGESWKETKADMNAPVCSECGSLMVPTGKCHCCPSCGTSGGCS